MTQNSQRATGPTHRSIELGVAAFTALFALIVMGGSVLAGSFPACLGVVAEGPQVGFFPFYVVLLFLASSIVNFGAAISQRPDGELFAEWGQLGKVMAMLVPTALYVALIPWIGIYTASIILIAVFMRWLGRYNWGMVAAVSLGVPLVTFFVFDRWFLLPLPKGPIEAYLGY